MALLYGSDGVRFVATWAPNWTGILLAAYLALVVGLFALGIALRLSAVVFPILTLLFPLLLVALPYLVYDLLFRVPHEGRFSRARAARRHSSSAVKGRIVVAKSRLHFGYTNDRIRSDHPVAAKPWHPTLRGMQQNPAALE